MKKIKLKRTLYIGIGGTGVSAILKAKTNFIDAYGEIPPMIGFLAIDTDKDAANSFRTARNGNLVKLDASELLITTVQNAPNVYLKAKQQFDWIPTKNIKTLGSIVGNGAGQVRSNGRFIARFNEKKIANAVTNAVNHVNELISLENKFTCDLGTKGVAITTINIACSIAGGSGSGMLIDILSIADEAMKNSGHEYNIYPWIVLPDVFKAMNAGPAMANVPYNGYGALKELDYLMHLNLNDIPLDFGYARINKAPMQTAFVFNNINSNGVTFTSIDDITDIVGKSMYLPANEMGDKLNSPFDNIVAHRMGAVYDVENKSAWATSCGSAELIYDNQQVGWALRHRLVIRLCDSLTSGDTNGVDAANAFIDHPNVMIRENNGRDDIIDSLLSAIAQTSIYIDLTTTEDDIKRYIESNTGKALSDDLRTKYDNKLSPVLLALETEVKNQLNMSNGVNRAKEFLSSLTLIIKECVGEMKSEYQEFKDNDITYNWNQELKSIINNGLEALIKGKLSDENTQLVQDKVSKVITNQREELRREWAIRFYNEVFEAIAKYELRIEQLTNNLYQIIESEKPKLIKLQQKASSKSKFAIFLHENDVMNAQLDSNFNYQSDFISYLEANKKKMSDYLGSSTEQLYEVLSDYSRNNSTIVSAVNVSIEDKLAAMAPEVVEKYLKEVFNLAAPMWNYNLHGYLKEDFETDEFVFVGVNHEDNTLISKYTNLFKVKHDEPRFASTYQTERLIIMRVEDLLPIYAVNNFMSYETAVKQREDDRSLNIAYWLDNKWKMRMDVENFQVTPALPTDNTLEMWVMGFIFKLIGFDSEKKEYYTYSRKYGKPLEKYRYALGSLRNLAYDNFKNQNIYNEIKEKLEKEIKTKGNTWFENVVQEVKDNDSYYEDYSQISEEEKSQLDKENFRLIKDLLEQEVEFITSN